jgi:hypothetical protein
MIELLGNSLVALALIASVAYALFALGPKGLRRRAWGALARIAARAHLEGASRRLAASAGKASAACGGCGSCESESPTSGGSSAVEGRRGEVSVPLGKIGKRRA